MRRTEKKAIIARASEMLKKSGAKEVLCLHLWDFHRGGRGKEYSEISAAGEIARVLKGE